ncbi:DUF1997 domain-containing protein [Prochlorothrix hollandica]|uniref:DUF1997 domain-containing protein n=1 Tax=Prochlorothrix hollandica TaxID=1223 RepID=UPI000694D9E1|nr:DUF1997 domain-containing protein [Prochlorothrix hollandica]
MRIQFTALQSVALSISQEIVPVEHYLRQPQRLIYALIEPERVEQRSASLFRFKLSPLKFLMLKIEPTVDLKGNYSGGHGRMRVSDFRKQT